MRKVSQGFSIPEERFNPQPFYYTNVAPPVYRLQELNWRYDARQRWFYTNFCGRTQESIWENECLYQSETNLKQNGDYSDANSWSLPYMVTGETPTTAVLGQPLAYSNYVDMSNQRPANPYTGRTAETTADPLYIATRHMFSHVAYRIAVYPPTAAEIAAAGSTGASNTYLGLGFEVNSQGSNNIMALELYDNGATLAWQLRNYYPNSTTKTAYTTCPVVRPVTINNDGWQWWEFEWDSPVLRFTQPAAGQTEYWLSATPPTIYELTIPDVSAYPYVQPMIFNESLVSTKDALTFYLNQWAIWPSSTGGNKYKHDIETNPTDTTMTSIFDTGGREYVCCTIKSIGTSQTYTIQYTGEGANQTALQPEVRTWRNIDDADYTGTTGAGATTTVCFFNASRFLRVSLTDTAGTGTREITWTANGARN